MGHVPGKLRLCPSPSAFPLIKITFLSKFVHVHGNVYIQYFNITFSLALEASQQKTAPVSKQQPVVTMVTEPELPKEPPPEWEFMIDPPSISRRHL